jgi:hypothetical protein
MRGRALKAPARLETLLRTFRVCPVTVKFEAFRQFWPNLSTLRGALQKGVGFGSDLTMVGKGDSKKARSKGGFGKPHPYRGGQYGRQYGRW